MFGSDTEGDWIADLHCSRIARKDKRRAVSQLYANAPPFDVRDFCAKKIHLWRTDEAGDETVLRLMIELKW